MGVFACGWLGWVFAFGLCSCGCLRFLGVGALAWGGGTVWLRPPLSRLLACVLTLWCGLEKRVREPVGGQVRGGNGAGQSCPAPCAAGWRCRRCVRVEGEKIEGGGARSEW